jgi:hypothetical protein
MTKGFTVPSYAARFRARQAASGHSGRRARYFLDEKAGCHYAPPVTQEAQKTNRRRIWLAICVGVILGFAGASARGPELVSLLFKPLQDSFSCSSSVNLALTQFVRLQLTCAVLGGVLGLAVILFWRRYMRQRADAKASRDASG